jgi:putative membrane protein
VVSWISSLMGFGLVVDSFFWAGIWGALVLAVISWILGLIFRPLRGRRR